MCHPGSVCTAMLSYLVFSLILFKLGDKHKLGAKLYRRYLVDTFTDKAFQSHDHNTGDDHTCPVSMLCKIFIVALITILLDISQQDLTNGLMLKNHIRYHIKILKFQKCAFN